MAAKVVEILYGTGGNTTENFDYLHVHSGRCGFRSTQGIQETTVYRYNMFMLNCMANPIIYHGH